MDIQGYKNYEEIFVNFKVHILRISLSYRLPIILKEKNWSVSNIIAPSSRMISIKKEKITFTTVK